MNLGSWDIDDLLTFCVVTHRFDTGVATDADAVPAYRIYEDETATPLLTGNMALLDSANTAGFYSEQVTLSAANGFEKSKSYTIHIAATVNAVAMAMVRQFQIGAKVNVSYILSDDPMTEAALADAVVAEMDAASTKLTDILADTAVIGTAGAGLTGLGGMSTTMKAQVNTEADTALADYDPPTRTEATADKDAVIAAIPTEAEIATVLLATNIETGVTLLGTLRVMLAALASKYSIDGNDAIFRDINDTTNRLTVTIAGGVRSASTINVV